MSSGLTQPIGSQAGEENDTLEYSDTSSADDVTQGDVSTETLEELISTAPSGEKIAGKCDEVHEYVISTFFPNNTKTWTPVGVFGDYSTSDHLQNVVNFNLSCVQMSSQQENVSSAEHVNLLLQLCANLTVLATELKDSEVTLSGAKSKHLELKELLLRKNISYQNSALNPVSIFGNLDAKDQLHSRMNDKLNRIKNNTNYRTEGQEDAVNDLIGYLILLLVYYDNVE